MNTKAISETRIETQQLRARLMQAQENEIVSYKELSTIAGVDVQATARHLLYTALKQAERDGGMLFGCVPTVGVKRLAPDSQPEELDRTREYIRRKAKRTIRRSVYADWKRMTDEQRATLNTTRTVLHFVANTTGDKQAHKLMEVVKNTGDALPFNKVLEHFAKKVQ